MNQDDWDQAANETAQVYATADAIFTALAMAAGALAAILLLGWWLA